MVVYQLELMGTTLVYNGCIPARVDGHQLTWYTMVVYQLELMGTNLVYNGCIPARVDGDQQT